MENQEVKILHGLPASGKTTFAKQFVKDNKNFKRLSRDDFRHMLDGYSLQGSLEDTITKMISSNLEHLLKDGFSVIIDNTNLRPKYIRDYMKVIRQVSPTVAATITSFADVPYEELLKRDENREGKVGKEVIDRMMQQLKANSVHSLRKVISDYDSEGGLFSPVDIKPKEGIPYAIVCDIDGTLAHMNGRSPYDWKRVGEDLLDEEVYGILRRYNSSVEIILLSGRDGSCEKETKEWLNKHQVPFGLLYMRDAGDQRKDNIVKYELFKKYIEGNWNILFVLDDRNQVVKMWRQIGLKCFQVADGDF